MNEISMNTIAVIKTSLQASLNNTATFPEHIKTIATVGVTRYEVNLLTHSVCYHFLGGFTHTEIIPISNTSNHSQFFAKTNVKAAIADIQKQVIDYPTFLERIISAGTRRYEVNIDDGKVIYQGENENYTEDFPKFTNR